MNRIAFFDFDGTITTKDTLLEFIMFSKGRLYFYLGFLLNSPWLLGMKLGIISNQKAKERILTFFFRGMSESVFQDHCNLFVSDVLPKILRPKALDEMFRLKKAGVKIVIVSASPEGWIKGWSNRLQADLIATKLAIRQQALTGKILGRNCHGLEKIRRIQEAYNLHDYQEVLCYGDSKADLPMLKMGNISFYKPFR